uniref:hypothetical protein n=1 Tax=Snodgrassella sp. CFCC 13594 TaxID=1775559 RepID=UPI000AF968C4
MKLFGLEIKRARALQPVPSRGYGTIAESFTGAWQQGIELKDTQSLMRVSAVFSCVARISGDIAKLGCQVMQRHGRIYTAME